MLNVQSVTIKIILCFRYLGQFSKSWSLKLLKKWLRELTTQNMVWQQRSSPQTSTRPWLSLQLCRPALSGKSLSHQQILTQNKTQMPSTCFVLGPNIIELYTHLNVRTAKHNFLQKCFCLVFIKISMFKSRYIYLRNKMP